MSRIEWTERTWNPVVGCTRVSAGCDHCYAVTMTRRLSRMAATKERYEGLIDPNKKHFNGKIRLIRRALEIPLRTKKPTMWFVNSMSDLFHEGVPDEYIALVFAVMALCPQHTFQVLTKRPERMLDLLTRAPLPDTLRDGWSVGSGIQNLVEKALMDINDGDPPFDMIPMYHEDSGTINGVNIDKVELPLKNVWLGVSVENQATANERVPILLQTPAAIRFVSLEPMLGPVDLRAVGFMGGDILFVGDEGGHEYVGSRRGMLSWVIVGGESGANARPMHPDWVRSVRDQCVGAGVPFFFKQGSKANWSNYKAFESFPLDLQMREYPGVVNAER
jgi:protein gp37